MSGSTPSTVIHTPCNMKIRITEINTLLLKPGNRITKKERNEIDGKIQCSCMGNTAPSTPARTSWLNELSQHVTCVLPAICIHYSHYTLPTWKVASLSIKKRLPFIFLRARQALQPTSSSFVLSNKTIFPRMRQGMLAEFQRMCTGLTARRGQSLGEHQRRTAVKKLRTIIWYKRACISKQCDDLLSANWHLKKDVNENIVIEQDLN